MPEALGTTITAPGRTAAATAVPDAIAHCRGVTERHSATFYLGSLLFPREQRQAVWAVYTACREGDDTVDENDPGAAARLLAHWRQSTLAALEGRPDAHPTSVALAWAAGRYGIPAAPFEELHAGLEMDLARAGYATLDDLLLYCRRVAGTVGWMILPITGTPPDEDASDRALKLGQAMQLTNILRDVAEDRERGRVYLPDDVLRRHGLSRQAVEAGTDGPAYRAVIAELAGVARGLYREGNAGLRHVRGRGRLAVAVAASLYEGILDVLERRGWDNLSSRASLTPAARLARVPGAALGSLR
ncbi:MAG TPA: phytoene/squalene synthase family protein [Deinococcales bacterium]|nr:phytoene/squalene synthase family protein [Deinococcales bacterium]